MGTQTLLIAMLPASRSESEYRQRIPMRLAIWGWRKSSSIRSVRRPDSAMATARQIEIMLLPAPTSALVTATLLMRLSMPANSMFVRRVLMESRSWASP